MTLWGAAVRRHSANRPILERLLPAALFAAAAVWSAPPPKPLRVAYGESRDLDFLQGLANRLEFCRLNDGNHQFHAEISFSAMPDLTSKILG